MTYDLLNRLTQIWYKPIAAGAVVAAKTVKFFYDQSNATTACAASFPLGRMTRFTDESGSTTLCYDHRGNVTSKKQINSVTLNLTLGYSLADRLISMTYPSGTTVAYGRDAQGRITNVSINGATFISSVSYLPFGPVGLAPSKNYCRAHPINCSGACLCGGIALSIAGGENDDYSDAMRHCIWSCCMAANIGQSGAKDVGDDNENVPNNPENSKNMDYCNNQTGRDCGKKPIGAYSYILGCTVCCAGSPLKTL